MSTIPSSFPHGGRREPAPAVGAAVVAVSLVLLLGAACSSTATPSPERPLVGVIMVGVGDDLGYNQAVREGAESLARQLPNVDVTVVPEVPEEDEAVVAALEGLVADGASVLFATSFGHLAGARTVAERHPEVVVVHQGGVEGEPDLPNFGTFFGRHEQLVTVAGVAAGAASRAGHIGMVLAFPIPASHANANALLLGARRVDPDTVLSVVFTGSWCDPSAQSRAVDVLVEAGADVLSQHQDCAATILGEAEARGLPVVGYHVDGREAAPSTWLTGAVWEWGPLYADIVATALRGDFEGSPYDADFRGGFDNAENPFVLSPPTDLVPSDVVQLMEATSAELAAEGTPFTGPLRDADGDQRVPEGDALTVEQIDALDWFVEGVTVREP